MKRLFLFVLISLIALGICGTVEARDRVATAISHGLPTGATYLQSGGTIDVPYKTFRIVRYYHHYTDSLAGGPGITWYRVSDDSMVIWDTSVSGDDGVTVTLSGITGDSRVAGVLTYGVTINSSDQNGKPLYASADTRNLYRWAYMQTYGPCYVNTSGLMISGDAICVGGAVRGGAARFGKTLGNGIGISDGYWSNLSDDAQYRGMAGFAMNDGTAAYTASGHIKTKVFLRGLN